MYLAGYSLLCQQITTKEQDHKQFLALCLTIIWWYLSLPVFPSYSSSRFKCLINVIKTISRLQLVCNPFEWIFSNLLVLQLLSRPLSLGNLSCKHEFSKHLSNTDSQNLPLIQNNLFLSFLKPQPVSQTILCSCLVVSQVQKRAFTVFLLSRLHLFFMYLSAIQTPVKEGLQPSALIQISF